MMDMPLHRFLTRIQFEDRKEFEQSQLIIPRDLICDVGHSDMVISFNEKRDRDHYLLYLVAGHHMVSVGDPDAD